MAKLEIEYPDSLKEILLDAFWFSYGGGVPEVAATEGEKSSLLQRVMVDIAIQQVEKYVREKRAIAANAESSVEVALIKEEAMRSVSITRI